MERIIVLKQKKHLPTLVWSEQRAEKVKHMKTCLTVHWLFTHSKYILLTVWRSEVLFSTLEHNDQWLVVVKEMLTTWLNMVGRWIWNQASQNSDSEALSSFARYNTDYRYNSSSTNSRKCWCRFMWCAILIRVRINGSTQFTMLNSLWSAWMRERSIGCPYSAQRRSYILWVAIINWLW